LKGKKRPVQEGIIVKKTNILPQRDRYRVIWYNRDDYATIMALSLQQKVPIVQVAHDLIVSYVACQKAGHEKTISQLKLDMAVLAEELTRYIDQFGKMPISDRAKDRAAE
jgi:hypothetical protein